MLPAKLLVDRVWFRFELTIFYEVRTFFESA